MATSNPENDIFKKGFPKEILNDGDIDPKYLCSLCELLLHAPVQSYCGHRFCEDCIKNLLKSASDKPVTCPSCEKEESENEFSDLKKTFPDNAIKREFANLTARCINERCTWKGKFKLYILHETDCEYQLCRCTCGQSIPKHHFEEHQQNECLHRTLICPYCNASVLAKDMEAHNNECSMFPMKCQGCGREGMPRKELLKHQDMETGDCEARAKICPLNCGKSVETDLKTHMSEATGDHMVVLTEAFLRMDKKVRNALNEGLIVADAVPIPPTIEGLYKKMADLELKLTTPLHPEIEQSLERRKSSADGASSGASSGCTERGQPDGEDVKYKIQVTDTKVNQFENTLAIITHSLDSFREETDQLHVENRELRATLEAQDRKLKGLEKSIQLKDLSLAEADLKIQALEQTVYDGVMTWKITDFARKHQDAISARFCSIYSPPFYTSKAGYKMCSRLYINGDGMGKGTHLSLFFVVMKGPYDALQKWPFRQKVTLQLVDQNNNEHVTEAFRPDPNSSSFRRPTSDMNTASGCPLFCQLSTITQPIPAYVKDNTMFIRIIVDTEDL